MEAKMKSFVANICLFSIVLLSGQAGAQTKFDVASIKPVSDLSPGVGTGKVRLLPGGRAIGDEVLVRYLIQTAYGLRSYQLLGGPAWIDSDHYQIDGKSEGNPTQQQLLIMLQSLLEEEFKLVAHREKRDLPVYELAVSKSGMKFRPKEQACADSEPVPYQGPGRGAPLSCGRIQVGLGRGGGVINGLNIPMSELVRVLSNVLGKTVIDRTNVTGTFDVHFSFAPDQALSGITLPPNVAPDPNMVTIFTAIEQQLGLKLTSTKGPVEVLVIDSIQKPVQN